MPKVNYRKTCANCKKNKADYEFYKFKNGEPMDLCSECLTRGVDNWQPDTFMWILKEIDIPYIESVWYELRDRECEKAGPAGLNGKSVIGKYISRMKLKQFKDYTYADTEKIKQEADALKVRSQEIVKEQQDSLNTHIKEMEENYKNGIITKEAFDNFVNTYADALNNNNDGSYKPKYTENPIDSTALAKQGKGKAGIGFTGAVNLHEDLDMESMDDEVSQEDKKYLFLKWGGEYTTEEWLKLEELFNKYMDNISETELDISREETIKAICKTLLRMNKAIDIQDLDAYQKLSKVFNDLSKAAKLQEVQKKERTTQNYFDNLGEFIALCEKEGGPIPDYKDDKLYNKDTIDKVIQDIKNHTTNIIKNELGLSNLIEGYIEKQLNTKTEDELASLDAAIDGNDDKFKGLSNAEIIERIEQQNTEKAEDLDLEKEFGFKMDDNGNIEQIESEEENGE